MGKPKSPVYETMYILRPDLGEERTEQTIEKYRALLNEQGAEQLEIQHRGKRRLAYEINKHRDGIYIQMNYVGPGTCIAVMERSMKMSEEVIRYLTLVQAAPEEVSESEESVEE
ncbi:30S ribosomal protein S6 [Oscillatoriales cyanobacterium LEGE 11467]|uniref:Small ribosomal subunit protein bS6 n=1 Tax=Zarconia navalis LEGE 11467 TaxID=1828826 RepID=A0A928VUH6_9CYAN|nr:30S ribosomal protein S6 [Zarconia navalis]MBE9040386.1 30S ribosomal protein S6 [Zarconia navalis LEGE 11467]